jgi:excisionase family DNA binding protein
MSPTYPDPLAHPIPLLRKFFPGALPDPEPVKPPPGAGLWTTEEAADYLSISAETLRRLARARAIAFVAVTPRDYRFRREDLEEYVASRTNKRRSALK